MPNLNDFKPLGAFIQDTIKPIIEELKAMGVDINIDGLNKALTKLVISHTLSVFLYCVRDIITVLVIGYFICKIYQS